MINPTRKNDLLILYISSSVLLILIFVFFIASPQSKKIKSLSLEIEENKNILNNAEYLISKKESILKEIEEMRDEINLFQEKLPSQKEIPKLLDGLKKIADNNYVKIISFEPDIERSIDPYGIYYELPIIIKLTSGYHQLGRFINNIENMKRLAKIKNIKVKKGSNKATLHDIELLVSIYTFNEKISKNLTEL